ncbi:DUF4446 family protein [Candidatus Gottesmanbacteria bacterium]|nr:DUF4446 family protein [Candidatus Gottesmanbacteria bacterium]
MVFSGTAFFALFIFAWIVALTIFVYRLSAHYGRLTKGASNVSLKEILESLLNNQARLGKKAEELGGYLKKLEADGEVHLQRIGILRYNPFSDTGGSQSFSLALLDGNDSGIVITSLYARSGNRWFVKEVENGKGKGVELSREEESAIRRAKTRTDRS